MSGRSPQPNRWAGLRPLVVLALCTTVVSAQTTITPPKNKYTPAAGRGARAGSGGRSTPAVSDHQDDAIDSYLDGSGDGSSRRRRPSSTTGVPVLVHAGEPEGHQRVRAARRADVRQPRNDRCRQDRGRGGRRHGARACARAAASRHRERHQGAGLSDRRSWPARSPAR